MLRIAHVSDVHILDRRPGGPRSYQTAVRFLSLGRRLDAHRRVRSLLRALLAAKRAGAEHVVVSGDLTESGADAQFDELGGALAEAPFAPDRVTLVPGNHDAYEGGGTAWKRALEGPLAAYRGTSAGEPGAVIDLGEAALLPVDVSVPQPVTRSSGRLSPEAADAVERRARDPALRHKAVVAVQHHPPFARSLRAWDWIDGLQGGDRMLALLARHDRLHVLHGHLHAASDRGPAGGPPRVFGAPAVVDDAEDAPRVRLYEARDGALESLGLA